MRWNTSFTRFAAAACVVLSVAERSGAQELATETIQLSAGWNFVWLNLEPDPDETQLVFDGVDFQTIWAFQPDPVAPAVSGSTAPGRWFLYDKDVPPEVNTLRFLQGQHGYVIKMNSPGQVTIAGRPIPRTFSFHAHVSNQFGALSNPLSPLPLTFERFFSHPSAQGKVRSSDSGSGDEIFTVSGESLVRLSSSDQIERHVGYWVNVSQSFEYRGPIDVDAGLDGISFGRNLPRRTVSIEVPASQQTTRSLFVRALPCARIGGLPFCPAGLDASWLEYLDPDRDPNLPLDSSNWLPLAAGLVLEVPPGASSVSLDVRARRDQPTAAAAASGAGGPLSLEALIEVSDEFGGQVLLPSDVEVRPVFGRWIGHATLTHVSAHPEIQAIALEEAEAPPVRMTLILDVPDPAKAKGQPIRLLDSVSLPGHRDGVSITRTLHATVFDRAVELQETEPLDVLGLSGTLTGMLEIQPTDALNPYRHRYHPEHRVGFHITRQITLQFETTADNPVDELLGLDGTFGPNRLTGTYTEIITGVSRDPITVRGSFELNRLTDQAVIAAPSVEVAKSVSADDAPRDKRSQ